MPKQLTIAVFVVVSVVSTMVWRDTGLPIAGRLIGSAVTLFVFGLIAARFTQAGGLFRAATIVYALLWVTEIPSDAGDFWSGRMLAIAAGVGAWAGAMVWLSHRLFPEPTVQAPLAS